MNVKNIGLWIRIDRCKSWLCSRLAMCHLTSLYCNSLRTGERDCWSLPVLYPITYFWLKAYQSQHCSRATGRSDVLMPSTGATQPWFLFGEPDTEMEVVMKGAVMLAEWAEGSLLAVTKGNNHGCYCPTASMLCPPEELLIEVITLLHVFFASISGNVRIIKNSKTIFNHPYSRPTEFLLTACSRFYRS